MPVTDAGLKVTFLTQYFPPEGGAPAGRMYELAKRLTDLGHEVTVVTAFPNYPTGVISPGYTGKRFMEEHMGAVRVLRTWVFATPNRGFFRRILAHFSFTFSSLTALPKLGRTDVIFVQSPPLLIGLATLAFSRFKRAPFVFNVSDLWPQSAIELGMLRNPLAIRVAEMFERHLYRRAARVTVPVPGMVTRLVSRGIPPEKVFLLTNGVDTAIFQPQPPDHDLAQKLGLDGHKIFMYAGTHGLSHGLNVILEAAKLTDDPNILYVLAGDGADKADLVAKAQAEGISNVRFLPNQPMAAMPALLNLAYASILSLKRLELFKSALPVKMYESMAVAHPMVAAVWGEAADLITKAQCGLVVEPENAQSISDAVKTLAADPVLAREMGERGREYVIQHYDRKDIADRLSKLLQETARPGSG